MNQMVEVLNHALFHEYYYLLMNVLESPLEMTVFEGILIIYLKDD